jgi:hypothetical protein
MVISNLLHMVGKFIIKFTSYSCWLTVVQVKTVFILDYHMTMKKNLFTSDNKMAMIVYSLPDLDTAKLWLPPQATKAMGIPANELTTVGFCCPFLFPTPS